MDRVSLVLNVEIEELVAVPATDLGNLDRPGHMHAGGSNFDASANAKDSSSDICLKYEIGAGVCHDNPRHRAFSTQIRSPGAGTWRIAAQAALLKVLAAVEVLEIVRAF